MKLFLSALLSACSLACLAQPGTLDPTFNPADRGPAVGDRTYDFAVQPDGGIVIVGAFETCLGVPRQKVARLHPSGELDASFNPLIPDLFIAHVVRTHDDGRIIISISTQSSSYRLVRLNADGSIDPTFSASSAFSRPPMDIVILEDGGYLVCGAFPAYVTKLFPDGTEDPDWNALENQSEYGFVGQVKRLTGDRTLINGYFLNSAAQHQQVAVLNPDGSFDTTFTPAYQTSGLTWVSPGSYILATTPVEVQFDSLILVAHGGSYLGQPGYLHRLHSDGSLDTSFVVGNSNEAITEISVLNDGRIFLGGIFSGYNQYNDYSLPRYVMLLPNGEVDDSFIQDVEFSGSGWYTDLGIKLIERPDGTLLLRGGTLTKSGSLLSSLQKLLSDGRIDPSFYTGGGADLNVQQISIRPDGRILIAGEQTLLNNMPTNGLSQMTIDGATDLTYSNLAGPFGKILKTLLLADGRTLLIATDDEGIPHLHRLSPDGSIDPNFVAPEGIRPYALAEYPDGRILIGGRGIQQQTKIVRLLSTGAEDPSFNHNTMYSGVVEHLVILENGKIVAASSTDFTQGNLFRLYDDGSLDATFPNAATGRVRCLMVQPDGRTLTGGSFGIKRLLDDATLDPSFNFQMSQSVAVLTMALQTNGMILVGGGVQTSSGMINEGRLLRLHSNGSIDTDFSINGPANARQNISSQVTSIALQSSDKLIVAGHFTSYQGVGRNRIVRIDLGTSTSVSPSFSEEHTFFPNPSSGIFHLSGGLGDIRSYTVRDITGRLIQQEGLGNKAERIAVDLSAEPAGIYFVTLTGPEGNSTSRLVKE